MLNFRSPQEQAISFNNSNFKLYSKEIDQFKPELIISDLDIYTSYIGINNNIPTWQVSSLLLYHAIEIKSRENIWKYYSSLFELGENYKQYLTYIIKIKN